MKKLTSIAAAVAVAFLIVGCATTQSTAGKTLSSVALTADATMKGWAVWVAEGQATPAQQVAVRACP